jgi:hypothetical protein
VHLGELTAPEQRVLGCLIEKRWTTPDQYPLSVNALRLACNQSTNRDPVTDYDETTVREAASRLSHYGLARLASGHSSRAIKYRHLAEEGLGLDRQSLALLGVLLLRGPQTPGELKGRSERMAHFETLDEVDRVLAGLGERGYVQRLARRPGQKEDRFEQLLGGGAGGGSEPVTAASAGAAAAAGQGPVDTPRAGPVEAPGAGPVATPAAAPSPASGDGNLEARVAALEDEVARLRAELVELLD